MKKILFFLTFSINLLANIDYKDLTYTLLDQKVLKSNIRDSISMQLKRKNNNVYLYNNTFTKIQSGDNFHPFSKIGNIFLAGIDYKNYGIFTDYSFELQKFHNYKYMNHSASLGIKYYTKSLIISSLANYNRSILEDSDEKTSIDTMILEGSFLYFKPLVNNYAFKLNVFIDDNISLMKIYNNRHYTNNIYHLQDNILFRNKVGAGFSSKLNFDNKFIISQMLKFGFSNSGYSTLNILNDKKELSLNTVPSSKFDIFYTLNGKYPINKYSDISVNLFVDNHINLGLGIYGEIKY